MENNDVSSSQKTYPSQLNTKAIACRVPTADYVSFLQESINQGISMNDWLLMKIYSSIENNIGNIKKSRKRISPVIEEEEEEIIFIDSKELLNKVVDKGLNYGIREGLIKSGLFSNLMEGKYFNKEDIENLLISFASLFTDYFDLQNHKKTASLTDVRTQLTILINNKYSNTKDRQEYRREVLDLLKELED
jgi:hypothetical protein